MTNETPKEKPQLPYKVAKLILDYRERHKHLLPKLYELQAQNSGAESTPQGDQEPTPTNETE